MTSPVRCYKPHPTRRCQPHPSPNHRPTYMYMVYLLHSSFIGIRPFIYGGTVERRHIRMLELQISGQKRLVNSSTLATSVSCQLTTQLVTQSIHTRVSRHLLKPAENPLSFPLLVLICPGINLKRNFTEICCCCCTYSLSWVCFRKSFGGICLGRIFITLPGRRIQDRAPRM